MDFEKGGRGAIERMVEAYGFTTRQALCDQLGVTKGTMANRYMRDSFPAEWVIQCSLETGVSLQWLTNGQGKMLGDKSTDLLNVRHIKFMDGQYLEGGSYIFDKSFLQHDFLLPVAVSDNKKLYIAEESFETVVDGTWAVAIDGTYSVRHILKLPGNRIRVLSESLHFDCTQDDISFLARVVVTVNW